VRLLEGVTAAAEFSPCREYRYTLTRSWGDGPTVLWAMLNPSTASHDVDDPTVRRTQWFSRVWGYERVVVCNLFALRSTDPKALYKHPEPVGPDNDRHIREEAERADLVVIAWGMHGALRSRGIQVLHRPLADVDVRCLGTTSQGQPRHPLYLRGDSDLVAYQR
jgi:hypothetical protein